MSRIACNFFSHILSVEFIHIHIFFFISRFICRSGAHSIYINLCWWYMRNVVCIWHKKEDMHPHVIIIRNTWSFYVEQLSISVYSGNAQKQNIRNEHFVFGCNLNENRGNKCARKRKPTRILCLYRCTRGTSILLKCVQWYFSLLECCYCCCFCFCFGCVYTRWCDRMRCWNCFEKFDTESYVCVSARECV